MAMRDESNAILEQTAITLHQNWARDGERHNAAMTNVAEQTKILFLEEKFKVGVREAEASKRMDDNKLAENVLAQRSAGQQPQAAGGPLPVLPK